MENRLEQFRKRHKLRKKKRRSFQADRRNGRPLQKDPLLQTEDRRVHPLFSKEGFAIRIMLSIALFLIVAIVFKQPDERLDSARQFVNKAFEQEFQFAAVSKWYEDQFGTPLALFPKPEPNASDDVDRSTTVHSEEDYAVPVTGQTQIVETFETNGQGVLVETKRDSVIESVKDGFVIFTGERENLGKTVIVQHHDDSESWYGHLEDIDVALYDYIESGEVIGKAADDQSGENSMFYFALKQGDSFIDPIQVISFE